jgi:hypothetical protein
MHVRFRFEISCESCCFTGLLTGTGWLPVTWCKDVKKDQFDIGVSSMTKGQRLTVAWVWLGHFDNCDRCFR